MCIAAQTDDGCIDLLDDPLVRLVMDSDGVSRHEIAELMERVRQALLANGRKAVRSAAQSRQGMLTI